MLFFVKKLPLFLIYIIISVVVIAQKKELTEEQYFKSNFKGIVQSLPVVTRWTDNSHFILLKDGKRFSVDAKSGLETELGDTNTKVIESRKLSVYNKN